MDKEKNVGVLQRCAKRKTLGLEELSCSEKYLYTISNYSQNECFMFSNVMNSFCKRNDLRKSFIEGMGDYI
jgi:hypothetical protein